MKIYFLLFIPAFIMAYLNMCSRTTIGPVVFTHIKSFEIHESVNEISNTATITMPRHYKELNGKPVRSYLNVGDLVTIEAGYNQHYKTEFTGYVRSIGIYVPIVIECDQMYPHRQNNIVESYRQVTLRELLVKHFNGFVIDCPDVQLGKLLLDNCSSYQLLEKLQKDYGFYTKVINNKTLHVRFIYDWTASTELHEYITGVNVKANALGLKKHDDFANLVKLTEILPNGKKKVTKFGSSKPSTAVTSYNILPSQNGSLHEIGNSLYKRVNYDGAEGKITGFGVPRVNAGDSLIITNKDLPELNGRFVVQDVDKNYGPNGFERVCTLAFKI